MTEHATRVIELEEYKPTYLPVESLRSSVAETIHRAYGSKITVDPPSFKNGDCWGLTSQGWVGYIPVDEGLGLRINPKVPLRNIVRMLEYAYGLESLTFFDQLANSASLQDFFSELANILARRVLDRGRRGFYKAYVELADALPFVRGRLSLQSLAKRPWSARVDCEFDEHLADVRENQLLAWTLATILRSGLARKEVIPTVRRAYHTVQSFTSVVPFKGDTSRGWLYNRLNDDYEPLHALCRFFLDHASPSHEHGPESTLPFLIDMARLFERFVAEWLESHLPDNLALEVQENVRTGSDGEVRFVIDLVVYDIKDMSAQWVLDTKYKAQDGPSSDDVAQVVTYAQLKASDRAALVYPVALAHPYVGHFRDVSVRSLTFSLADDLEEGGNRFLASLTGYLGEQRNMGR